ncbi:uncharacterized protein G2W53_014868 [Senna tora]|uniref:Uncharacterized protein n=1 Tax=Senna tora TaxID=362788 RepID=A0A834WU55_9FABA|nr:uncharacterized protein G2W53_014868 [Senna tora]
MIFSNILFRSALNSFVILARQKLSPSKEDPWPPDRSLSTVVSLHQISRCRRLVAADLAEQNAEVLRESEGEEASAVTEEEVSGLEVSEGNLLSCAASVDAVDEKDY